MAPPPSQQLLPPILQNSHDDGSHAALLVLLLSFCMWELLYRVSGLFIQRVLSRYPHRLLDSSLRQPSVKNGTNGTTSNGGDNNGKQNGIHTTNNNTSSSSTATTAYETAQRTLLYRGPSYLVSFLHSIYATSRGCYHLYQLWNASNLDKLLIPSSLHATTTLSTTMLTSYRPAHLSVAQTNTLFLSYLLYDLCHVLHQYPKLGGVDTILHHILFASCSLINGTFGLMAFCFGWLVVGEGSTIFLNVRWYLLKSKRENGRWMQLVNGLFAISFFITRIGIYSSGMIHLLYYSWDELLSLPQVCGVPWSMLGLTCGCMMLGWVLNFVWGYKILCMVVGGGKKKKRKPKNE
ncbi:hypothetical protein ACHAWU_007337 [Discostella pseudostelligera]|uniref:TLC domain-containing protein n=1 Tax=Discostella pseudostelligera TaxID=259834 RepID=A0ABD3LZR0_9STRA